MAQFRINEIWRGKLNLVSAERGFHQGSLPRKWFIASWKQPCERYARIHDVGIQRSLSSRNISTMDGNGPLAGDFRARSFFVRSRTFVLR
jgi:hypothetical protein